MTIGEALERLQTSDFRARFHLGPKERAYVEEKGLPVIREHARDFVRTRLAPADIPNDGKQTPKRGHPVLYALCANVFSFGAGLWLSIRFPGFF